MVDMKWQNPPSRSSRGTQYDEIIEELKKNPGRWALISEDWKTSGPPSPFKKAGCIATCRANKDTKTWSLYARYPTGPAPEASKAPAADKAAAKAVPTRTTPKAPAAAPTPAEPAAQPAGPVKPANDFGLGAFRAARAGRGVPPEGKR